MVRFVLVLVLLLVVNGMVDAQTDTPTPSETPTPELAVLFTLPAPEVGGTPQPGQDVILVHTINLDQVAVGIFEFAVLVLLWIMFVVARLRRWI